MGRAPSPARVPISRAGAPPRAFCDSVDLNLLRGCPTLVAASCDRVGVLTSPTSTLPAPFLVHSTAFARNLVKPQNHPDFLYVTHSVGNKFPETCPVYPAQFAILKVDREIHPAQAFGLRLFCWAAGQFLAAKRRQNAAHGVSHGWTGGKSASPEGAKEKLRHRLPRDISFPPWEDGFPPLGVLHTQIHTRSQPKD